MTDKKNKQYRVGIYCRLSKDDGKDIESASIATQKSILIEYVQAQGWQLIKTYVDDGYSGTNFDRPDFQNIKAVIADINSFANMAIHNEKAIREIERRLSATDTGKIKTLEKEQRRLSRRLTELDRLFSALYEDKVMERITERNYELMSEKYEKEQNELDNRLREIGTEISQKTETAQGITDFLSLVKSFQGITELTASTVNSLIEKIIVSERTKGTDGKTRQEIKIYYKFVGLLDELHIVPTKRWTALPARSCDKCGAKFIPGSSSAKYCSLCRDGVHRQQSNDSKRRSRAKRKSAI